MVDKDPDYYAKYFDEFEKSEGQRPPKLSDQEVENLLLRSPNSQALRMACLELATKFDPEAGEAEVMKRAKVFADFVLQGTMPEYPNPDDEEVDDEGRQEHLKRRYGTTAFISPEDEEDIIAEEG
jgi:hypothetical protein